MKAGLLATGIILMLIGAVGYLAMQQNISDCGSFVGQLGRMFSSSMGQKCQMANMIQLGGAVLFVLGIGLTIGGAVSGSKSSSNSRGTLPTSKPQKQMSWVGQGIIFGAMIIVSILLMMVFPFPYGLIAVAIFVIVYIIILKAVFRK